MRDDGDIYVYTTDASDIICSDVMRSSSAINYQLAMRASRSNNKVIMLDDDARRYMYERSSAAQ